MSIINFPKKNENEINVYAVKEKKGIRSSFSFIFQEIHDRSL